VRYALLIGVSSYESEAFANLDVTRRDVAALSSVLEDRGYVVEAIGTGDESASRALILTRLRAALANVPEGATLLVYFSGHGVHYEEASFLVPSDCPSPDEDPRHLADYLVPLDAVRLDSSSPASGLLTLVDACRDGVNIRAKAPSGLLDSWTAEKQAHVVGQREARIFGCSAGERCRFEPSIDGLSLFTRAIIDVIQQGTSDVVKIAASAQERLDALARRFQFDRQVLKLESTQDFASDARSWFAPGFEPQHLGGGPVRRLLTELAIHASDGHQSLMLASFDKLSFQDTRPASPAPCWRFGDFDERITLEIRRLVASPPALLSILTPVEIFALALACVARELFVSAAAEQFARKLAPGTTGDAMNDTIRAAYPALGRKLDRLGVSDPELCEDLVGWLAGRYALDQRSTFESKAIWRRLDECLADVEPNETRRTELTAILVALSRAVAASSEEVKAICRSLPPTVALGGELGLYEFRPHVLAYLLAAAGALAVDGRMLSEVVPAQIGLRDGLDAQAVQEALAAIRWVKSKVGWDLDLSCPHPAIDMALREWVDRTNELLNDIGNHGEVREVVTSMLYHVSGSLLRPSLTDDGPTYSLPHVSFYLSTDETRELLMGSELYGDPNLAFRELYQNALDACRYRDARTRYLEARGIVSGSNWSGKIVFTAGEDSERPYVECVDNGIGMGRQEIDRAFARAGVRFQDLPDFVDEYHEWQKYLPDLVWSPTSRFGIGVFSYFMVAEEIEVETARLSRKGRPEGALKVDIAGSGALFRVRPVSESRVPDGGTRVRLFLSGEAALEPGHCGALLQSVLRLVEFETVYRRGASEMRWQPDQVYRDGAAVKCQRGSSDRVWWVDGASEFVVDGISLTATNQAVRAGQNRDLAQFVDLPPGFARTKQRAQGGEFLSGAVGRTPTNGCVVNLGGNLPVRLSVDRLTVREWPKEEVSAAVSSSVASLPAWAALTYDWIWTSGAPAPVVVDMEKALIGAEIALDCRQIKAIDVPVSSVGLVPADGKILAGSVDDDVTIERWFVGARSATWREAVDESLPARTRGYVVPDSLKSYPAMNAHIGGLFDIEEHSETQLPELGMILEYAVATGGGLGLALRDLRRYSMLAGERPRLSLGALAEAKALSHIWESLKMLPAVTVVNVLWPMSEELVSGEEIIVEDLGRVTLKLPQVLSIMSGSGQAPADTIATLEAAGVQIDWADRTPPWVGIERPLDSTELLLLSRDFDGKGPWQSGDILTLVGRIANREPDGLPLPTNLIAAVKAVSGDDVPPVLSALEACEGEVEIVSTCKALVYGLSINTGLSRLQAPFGREELVVARWHELAGTFSSLEGVEASSHWGYIWRQSTGAAMTDATRRALLLKGDGFDSLLNGFEIPFVNVVRAASHTEQDVQEVVREIREFCEQIGVDVKILDEQDVAGVPPPVVRHDWVDWRGGAGVGAARTAGLGVIGVAGEEGLTVEQVLEDLDPFVAPETRLGLRSIFASAARQRVPRSSDVALLTALAMNREWPITLLGIARAAHRTGRQLGETVDLVADWLPVDPALERDSANWPPIDVTARHLVALSRDLDGNDPWVRNEIDGLHMLRLAGRFGTSLGEVDDFLNPLEAYGVSRSPLSAELRDYFPSWEELCVVSDLLDTLAQSDGAERDQIALLTARSSGLPLTHVSAIQQKLESLLGWG